MTVGNALAYRGAEFITKKADFSSSTKLGRNLNIIFNKLERFSIRKHFSLILIFAGKSTSLPFKWTTDMCSIPAFAEIQYT
jgi:hypothetical protein